MEWPLFLCIHLWSWAACQVSLIYYRSISASLVSCALCLRVSIFPWWLNVYGTIIFKDSVVLQRQAVLIKLSLTGWTQSWVHSCKLWASSKTALIPGVVCGVPHLNSLEPKRWAALGVSRPQGPEQSPPRPSVQLASGVPASFFPHLLSKDAARCPVLLEINPAPLPSSPLKLFSGQLVAMPRNFRPRWIYLFYGSEFQEQQHRC